MRVLVLLLALAAAVRFWYLSDELSARRFFDERFSFENVSVVLGHGKAPRLQAFYPSLSFLPQAAVLAASDGLHRLTGASIFRVHDGTTYTPTAYALVRSISALYGVASLAMLFLVGRRLFSPAVGLLAALIFGAMPRHIYASALFKPDGLVVLLVLVTFWWSLDAWESGRRRDFWRAGFGFGLAMAAKYTALAAFAPLAIAALAGHWRDARRWRWLLEAGAVSLLTFALLNPHLATVLRFLPRLWRIGREKGTDLGVTPGAVAGMELRFLLDNHGPLLLLLAAAGAVGLPWVARRRPAAVPAVPLAMVASFVVAGSLAWMAVRLFRGLYYLPVGAFTSLAAAWGLAELWRLARERLPPRARAGGAWLAALLVAAAVLAPCLSWVYRERVVTTWRAAGEELEALLPPPFDRRSVAVEVGGGGVPLQVARRGLLQRRVAVLGGEPAVDDAELFPASRLEGTAGAAYRARLAAPGVRLRRVRPAPFRVRGPEVVLLVRGWREAGRVEPARGAAARARNLRFVLAPSAAPGEHGQLEVRFRALPGVRTPSALMVAGRREPLHLVARRMRRYTLRTARFPLAEGSDEVAVALPPRLGWPVPSQGLALWRWRPAAPEGALAGEGAAAPRHSN